MVSVGSPDPKAAMNVGGDTGFHLMHGIADVLFKDFGHLPVEQNSLRAWIWDPDFDS